MDPLTYEALVRNPEVIDALVAQAHRERAEAVYRLIVAPVWSFFARLLRHTVQPSMRTTACG